MLCVDEKTQVQALERRQPMLPLGLGYIEGVTRDYVRHGTTTLFAALDIANGQVMTQCRARHRHQEFLGFLKHIEANVPSDLDVHMVVDNYAAHKHPKVRAWLAARPRWKLNAQKDEEKAFERFANAYGRAWAPKSSGRGGDG